MTAHASTYIDLTPVAFMRRPPDHRIVLTVLVASVLAVDLLHSRPLSDVPAPFSEPVHVPASIAPDPASSFTPDLNPPVSLV
jgi:hypothetical protein